MLWGGIVMGGCYGVVWGAGVLWGGVIMGGDAVGWDGGQ